MATSNIKVFYRNTNNGIEDKSFVLNEESWNKVKSNMITEVEQATVETTVETIVNVDTDYERSECEVRFFEDKDKAQQFIDEEEENHEGMDWHQRFYDEIAESLELEIEDTNTHSETRKVTVTQAVNSGWRIDDVEYKVRAFGWDFGNVWNCKDEKDKFSIFSYTINEKDSNGETKTSTQYALIKTSILDSIEMVEQIGDKVSGDSIVS